MPSRYHGQFVKRKGGAWKKTKKGKMLQVGCPDGDYSKRDTKKDYRRKAKPNSHWKDYPEHYDKKGKRI